MRNYWHYCIIVSLYLVNAGSVVILVLFLSFFGGEVVLQFYVVRQVLSLRYRKRFLTFLTFCRLYPFFVHVSKRFCLLFPPDFELLGFDILLVYYVLALLLQLCNCPR